MRRILKAVLVGAPIGDVSTLEDDASVEDIKNTYEEMRKQLSE
jgi:acetyl-CoA synthetase